MFTILSRRNLWLMRAYYFLWIGAGGFLLPFLPLVYRARGLSGTEIGLLSTCSAIAGMLVAPVWGRLGDRSGTPRRLLQASLLAIAGISLLRGLQVTFWGFAAFAILDSLVNGGVGSLSSTEAMATVHGDKAGFGSIRLWGSLGWAAAAPVAGHLMEYGGLYVPFAGYAAMLILADGMLLGMKGSEHARQQATSPETRRVGEVLKALRHNHPMLGLALALFLLWTSGAGRQQFESIFLSQLGAPAGLIGLANTIGALIEPPFMLLADRFLRRHGAGRVLQWSFLLQGLAYLPVVVLPSIPSIFILRILFSIAFSLFVVSYVTYLVENAPYGQGATTVSLFDVTLRAGVSLLAAPLAGRLFDLLGAHHLYFIGLGGCLLAWSAFRLMARR